MNSIETLTTFFGRCTVINFGWLFIGGLSWILVKEGSSKFAATLFGVTKEEIKAVFFHGLMQYRAAVFVLNLVPYIALEIMA